MRSYLVCSLVIVLFAASGCGDDRPSVDARDGAGDGSGDGNANADRADVGTDMRVDAPGGSGGGTAGTGGSTAGTGGGIGGTGGGTAGTGGADAGTDAGGSDGGTPTCSDGIKNSDETGIDCGGHCGKCGPGGPCLVNADCLYTCKADKTCAACNVAADCPGAETECDHRTCTAGACGNMREAAGTVLTVQATGDCKRRQCAADGTVAVANDDTDVPDDRNPCTNDICTTGAPSHTMMPANSNCGGANHCNATGQCVGCSVAADCPGTDTACRTRTCTAGGVCGFSFTASGTKLVDPTARDCKGLQCDGAGNSQVVNDAADLPVDNNACTTDECSAGTPANRPEPSGKACGGSLVCDGASNCVECLSASTCPGTDTDCHTRSCVSGECGISNTAAGTLVAGQTPNDCKKNVCSGQGATISASDDLDLPVDGNPCTSDVCSAGTPSNPFVTAGNSCGANTICDGQGACVTCLTHTSCPGTDTECHMRTCTNGVCGISNAAAGTPLATQMAGDCKRSQCDGQGQSIVVDDNGDVPNDGKACTDDICTSGVPSNPNLASGTSCGANLMCNGQGACVGCITAANCGTDTTCQTHTCTNGQCGVTNAAAGTPLPAGSQTAGDCKRVQCDGSGQTTTVNDDNDRPVDTNACTQDLCNAGIPSNPPEAAGTTCSQGGGTRCNGSGTAPACVQCLQPSQCPGSDTACQVRTCSAAGVCGTSNTADGTEVGTPAPGDCKKTICMTGAQVTVNDNADVPVDGNACTMDLCTSGTPSNPPQAANAPCNENGGTRCNGSATVPACVQCLTNGHCGNDTLCQMHICSAAGTCGVSNVANGTVVGVPVPGDCRQNVCNGSGIEVSAIDDLDIPVDNNACTFDVCTAGQPTNPSRPANDPCSQDNGTRCNGSGTCVQCIVAGHCGTDTACKTFTCSAAGVCGSSNADDGTLVTNVPVGNCHRDVCMTGAITTVVDDNDVDVDGNLCTDDVCSGGVSSHPNVAAATSCGPGLMCNGNGACVGCLTDDNCPQPPNDCQVRVCMTGGVCGFTNKNAGTPSSTDVAGDCHQDVCDGFGDVLHQIDDNDKPATTNQCLQSVCTAGVPSNPPFGQGVACTQNNGTLCNGAGACVECLTSTTCPGGPDSECHQRTCSPAGVCGIVDAPPGTAASGGPSGDCQKNVCDGTGGIISVADDADVPAPNNQCTLTICLGGSLNTTNRPHGTSCTVNGLTCDGGGSCMTTFSVLRVNGTTNSGTAVTIEERRLDGGVVTATNIPATAMGGNFPLVISGGATSEGGMSLSGDGRYLILPGYNATTATTNLNAAGVNRVVGRVDAASPANINITTQVTQAQAFGGNNVRGATSQDGTSFWMSGAGTGGGVVYVTLGNTTVTQLTNAQLPNIRWVHIFGGQLYGTSNQTNFSNVFSVGTGLPTAAPATAVATPGMPAGTGPSPFSFVFADRDPLVPGFDRLYVADDGGTTFIAANQGIQKWTLAQGATNWTRVATFNLPQPAPPANTFGFRGLAGIVSPTSVTLIGSTSEATGNRLVVFVDTDSGTPVGTVVGTAGAGTAFRGVTPSPHL
jgi:hypothetical protein